MKTLMTLLALSTPVSALDLSIGASTSNYNPVIVIEYRKNRNVFTGVYMEQPHDKVDRRGILMAQKQFGDKTYFRFGGGISNRTELNSVFNFCMTVGKRIWKLDMNYTHCSNASTRSPNGGIDYISVGYRK